MPPFIDYDVKLSKMKELAESAHLQQPQDFDKETYEDTVLETESAIHYPVISQEKKHNGFDIRGFATSLFTVFYSKPQN